MELTQYLFQKYFPLGHPDDPGSVDEGMLLLICLSAQIDQRITITEVEDALFLIRQLHGFQEYDDRELGELIARTIERVEAMGAETAMELIGEMLPDPAHRELGLQIIAYIHRSDDRLAPVEQAMFDRMQAQFGISEERRRELMAQLAAQIGAFAPAPKPAPLPQPEQPEPDADNPLLAWRELPRFDVIDASHVVPGVDALLVELQAELDALRAQVTPQWDALMLPLSRIQERMSFAWRLIGHLLAVRNSPELRQAYQQVQPRLIQFSMAMGQDRAIYEGLRALAAQPDLDEAQRRILDSAVRDAQHSGVGLEDEARARFNAIQTELAEVSTRFGDNLLDATKQFSLLLTTQEEVVGLQSSARQLMAQAARAAGHEASSAEDGPWLITLDAPCVIPVLQDSARRELREQVYRAYNTRASDGPLDNAPLIERVLALRREEAALLGFETYAQLSLSSKMAPGVEAVFGLIEELRQTSYEGAKRDLEELREFARERGAEEAEALEPWDIAFWSERLREARYGFNDEALRPYFPLPHVLQGLFSLVEELFGARVVQAPQGAVSTWHPDVSFYDVFDERGDKVASFFLDPYSRPAQKRGGAWHGTCQGRSAHLDPDGAMRLPVSYLVCNQSPPVGDQPSLMSFQEVLTLFHEFGHGLQHMLTRVDYGDAAGISNIEWDAVELPSQFMENWCYERDTLKQLSRHVASGESLPDALIDQLLSAKNFRAASGMLRQLYFGALDMSLHARFEPGQGVSPFELQREVASTTSVLPVPAWDRFLCGFSHIFSGGYAAGYYSYKWAEVLSADAFAAFEDAGLHDPQARRATGRRFRETVLAMGGARDPMRVFEDFRGRQPSTEPLLRHNGLR